MNEAQELLLKNIVDDQEFRARFYASPGKAAGELGITLDEGEKEGLDRDLQQIKDNIAAYDKVRQFYEIGAPIKAGFFAILPGLV